MAEISCWRQPPNAQYLNGSNFWATCLICMNNPSLESYYVVLFKYYAFDHFSCDVFADVSRFSSISKKVCHVVVSNPIQYHLMFLVYLLATNRWSVCRFLKKLINERSTMFRGSAVQKLEEKCLSVKIWKIFRKICLGQQKMNDNDAIIFLYFERTTQKFSNEC